MHSASTGYDIAVIGVAGRFPGACSLAQFWRNLRNGVESVKFFTDEELWAAGESPDLLADPAYVKAQPVLEDFDRFDAAFFGFSPQDAAIMDPQHRVFLEVGWEALENAGHDSESFLGNIGMFATCGMNTYMMYHLVRNRRIMDTVGEWLVRHTGNDMNFLATRLSYELNLKGPSMNVQTACSSALVAIHLACQSLLSGECDMALAGGSTIVIPQNRGYLSREGEILSNDGHCRAFDAKARGTLFGSGAGVVVLRRLADAAADGDQILAIIKGSAITNDGSDKVGYLAPSVNGQAKAIIEALTISEVDPETISYIEAHGTGTIVGDPIEMVALTQAFRQFTEKNQFCAIGSLKSNIGHLGEAAGVAALIKTVLALNNREIPPSLHYEAPNPQIDFANSPFYVNAKLAPWLAPLGPRRAGITSLGAGGTNCHVIVEEPPVRPPSGPSRSWQLLLLSADTPSALETATENLATHLEEHPELNLADVAYTLHAGRKGLTHRRAMICRNRDEAIVACKSKERVITSQGKPAPRPVVFLFPGQGAQYPNMGRDLYVSEPVFRDEINRCAEILKRPCGVDIREVIFPTEPRDGVREQLNQTQLTQPALFLIEYALAKLWMSWGVQPRAMIGHSIGEYVAACLAGVFSLADALALVADRGRLMQQTSGGSMLAVPLPPAEIERLLSLPGAGSGLSLAAVNAPMMSVVAGPDGAVAAWEEQLAAGGLHCQRLQTSHAFHSPMMDPILASFAQRVRRVSLHPPAIPYLSNLTGTWIRPEDATNPDYWVQHLRRTVRFSECLSTLLENDDQVLLEVGPGGTLRGLVRQQPAKPAAVLSSLGRYGDDAQDLEVILKSYGNLWVLGCKLDAGQLYDGQRRSRVPLPTYPFERQRYWIEPDTSAMTRLEERPVEETLSKKPDLADWFFLPTWKRVLPPVPAACEPGARRNWLVFLDECGLGSDLIEQVRQSKPPEMGPGAVSLEIAAPGDVDSLTVGPTERHQPGPGEVEIRVSATALNFADVLKVAGVFPDAPFGMECAGLIERVGSGVAGFRPGDEVVAIGPESFRSYVIRDAGLVTHKPGFLTMEEAVTLPAAFMTAWYSLHRIGRLQPGEKVLIHAASGGVGLAAVQVARLTGAEIYATAGSKEKRGFLESLGIRHVFDSRSLDFADEVMRRTRGHGVNVVLNSLTGAFIPQSFSALSEGGRFLEIGKKEIYSPSQLAALPLRPKVSYHPIDLTRLLRDDPEGYGSLLREVVEEARQRRFEPLPRHVFAFSEASKAFRLMLQTRHIGKVVLSMNAATPEIYVVRAGAEFRRQGEREFVMHPGREADYGALFEALEVEAAGIGRIVHLWNVPADSSNGDPLQKWLDRGFFSLSWLAKAVGHVGWEQPIDLAVVSTGLRQIAGETRVQPAKATLQGPCRVIPREFPNLTCRSIDVPETSPSSRQREQVVRELSCELWAEPTEHIVAYRNTDRWVQQYVPAPLRAVGQIPAFRHGGVYLITGGLGGLGLAFAEHISRASNASLILVSRSELPARSGWSRWLQSHEQLDPISEKIRRIQECEKAGATVSLETADITDHNRMRAVIAKARKRFGVIHGVIHAAGTLDDGLIQLKTSQSALGVLAPKVKGTLILDDVLGDEPRDFFALFSSVSSILGIEGQVDYSAANAFLDAFASSRSARGACQTVAINWSAWREAGMAARRAAKPRGLRPEKAASRQARHPWLGRRHPDGTGTVFVTEFSRSRQWLLDEHAIRDGVALIPGTGYLELVRAGLLEVEKAQAIDISRVFFQAPFVVANGESKELSVTLQPADSWWDFRIESSSGGVTHVTGRVAPSLAQRPNRIDITATIARCNLHTEVLDGFLKQSFMDFGRRWGNLRQIRFGRGEALLTLELPLEYAADLESFPLHPALLDMATGGAQALIPGFDATKDFYVPFSYSRLVTWDALSRRLYSHVKLRDTGRGELAVFDVTITDESGLVLVEISEFVMKRVADRAMLQVHREAGSATSGSSSARLAEQAVLHGIEPREGIKAFERILASGVGPQIVVSSMDLHLWMKQADAIPEPTTRAAVKPLLSNQRERATVVPIPGGASDGDPIEKRLAKMYREILGVSTVKLRDDFFELGGHSLLAVRLLARIEREFKKAIPLPALFQSPTIEHLATFLRDNAGTKRKESSAITPLNEGGEGPAFYCVHSIGGEVMSFRHLAIHLGPDQRIYGIQAPPEMRTADFASSIESMARFYVDALIDVQPEGPYLLGGWSAGSAIALEMAHQLEASGRVVELLVAIDGAPPGISAGTSPWNPVYYGKLLCNLPGWISEDLSLDFSVRAFARRVRNKLVSLSKISVAVLRGEKNRHNYEVEGFMETSYFSDSQVKFMGSLFNALHTYISKPYHGRVLLYKAKTEPLYHLLEVEKKWSKITSQLEVIPVRGTHDNIVREPYVRAVAESLREVLAAFHEPKDKPADCDEVGCSRKASVLT